MFQQKVLVEELEEPPVPEGKLLIPQSVAKNLARGRIVAVDEGKLRVGDTILYDNRQALPCKLEEHEYLVIHESSIIGVFGKNKVKKLNS